MLHNLHSQQSLASQRQAADLFSWWFLMSNVYEQLWGPYPIFMSFLHLLTRYLNPTIQLTRLLSLIPCYGPREISMALSQRFLQVKVITLLSGHISECVLTSTEEGSSCEMALISTVHTLLDSSLDDFILSARCGLNLCHGFSPFTDCHLLLMKWACIPSLSLFSQQNTTLLGFFAWHSCSGIRCLWAIYLEKVSH